MQYGQPGLHVPPLTKINKYLLVILVGCFILQSIVKTGFDASPEFTLGLSGGMFFKGAVYQFFTYPFVQPGFFNMLFNGLVLWFFGSDLESKWGDKFYLKFLGISVLGGAILYLAIISFFSGSSIFATPLLGIQGICFSILVAYGILNSDAIIPFMLIFPMKAKYFCLLLIGIELYSGLFATGGKASWGHLGAMAAGFLFLKYQSDKSRKKKNKIKVTYKMDGKSSHLKLVKDEDKADPQKPKFWQ